MRQAFIRDLEYLRTQINLLPDFIRDVIIKGPDFSKPNVSYWIACLKKLVVYYKKDVRNLNNLKNHIDTKNTERDSLGKSAKFQTIARKIEIKVTDREQAIIACSHRLERDLK
ncbi:MAG: hypothetical protein ACRC6V_03860 [Bacteroidales bacterium]